DPLLGGWVEAPGFVERPRDGGGTETCGVGDVVDRGRLLLAAALLPSSGSGWRVLGHGIVSGGRSSRRHPATSARSGRLGCGPRSVHVPGPRRTASPVGRVISARDRGGTETVTSISSPSRLQETSMRPCGLSNQPWARVKPPPGSGATTKVSQATESGACRRPRVCEWRKPITAPLL